MKITKKPSQFLYKSNKWSVNTHWDSHTFEKLERQIFKRRKRIKEREQKPTNANIFKKTKTKSSESNEGNINKNKNYTSIKNEQTQKLCHPILVPNSPIQICRRMWEEGSFFFFVLLSQLTYA